MDKKFKPTSEIVEYFTNKRTTTEIRTKINDYKTELKKEEEVLRKEVRRNYRAFLRTNEEIRLMESNITDLKRLVDESIQLVKTLRGLDYKSNSSVAAVPRKMSTLSDLNAEDSVTATFSESTRELPSWVVSAASDVDRLTVQQQFQPAVQIILNIRKYRQGVDANFQKLLTKSQPKKSLPEAAAQQEARDKQYRTFVVLKALCKAVEDRAQSLTNAIAVTLPNLSKSQLWGQEEHSRRLRLLVLLGEHELAAASFCDSQLNLVSRTVAELQSTGSSLDYINLISESFFGHIIDATDTFLELFSNHSFEISNQKVLELDPLILSHLTEWIQSQITSFVKMILTQIKIGVGEKSSSTSMQLRLIMSTITTTTTAISNNSYIGTKDVSSRSRGASNEAPYNSYKSSDINGDHSPKGSNEGKENNDEVAYLKLKCEGPLLFLSQCLEILCSRATKLDSLNLQGKPCVCLYLVPELLHLVEAYGESIIRETYHLIQSETWLELENSSFLSVLTPSVHQNTLREKKNEVNSKKKRMCNSYTWLVNALTYFLEDACLLFQIGDVSRNFLPSTSINPEYEILAENKSEEVQSSTNKVQLSYSRFDVAEIEQAVVVIILRIAAKYCLELESVAVKKVDSFSPQQLSCFVSTLKSTVVNFLPSIHAMLTPFSSAAVSRGNKGGSDSGLLDLYSPQVLLQALCVRLESKGKPLEQQLMKVYQSNPQLQLEKTESKIVSSPNPSPNSNSIATGIVNNNSPKSNIAANVDPSGSLLDVPPPPSTYVRSNNPPTSVNLRKSPALAATDTSTESNNGRSQSTSQSTNTNTNTPSNSWLHSSSRPQYQATLLSALESNSNKDDDDDDDDEEVHL